VATTTPQRTLTFHVEVSDTGFQHGLLRMRREISGWQRIGRIEFTQAVASYNGDFVLLLLPAPAVAQ